jgi:hypothetical protein
MGCQGIKYWRKQKNVFVGKKYISGTFSTLGGNNNVRSARNKSHELLLLLKPKKASG